MFRAEQFSVKPALADAPVELPIRVFYALPDYVTNTLWPSWYGGSRRVNVFDPMINVVRRFGWDVVMKIVLPSVWAPELDTATLKDLLDEAFEFDWLKPKRSLPYSLREADFLDSYSPPSEYARYVPDYEIVHFVGRVHTDGSGMLSLDLGGGVVRPLTEERLTQALHKVKTRLLILQVPGEQLSLANKLARHIVEAGGPAVLTVAGSHGDSFDAYFAGLYANILHNIPLPDAAGRAELADIEATLFYGEGAESLLQFDRWLDILNKRLIQARKTAETLQDVLQDPQSYVHSYEADAYGREAEFYSERGSERGVDDLLSSITAQQDVLNMLKQIGQFEAHESGGVVPLAEVADTARAIEGELSMLQEDSELMSSSMFTAIRVSAPRVLNANFRDMEGQILEPHAKLLAGHPYDMLVDIGPQWNTIKSIVTGHSEFPEKALPPDKSGYLVHVVLVSDQLSPQLSAAEMWVPRHAGRSFPVVDGRRADSPGPIALHFRAPEWSANSADSGDVVLPIRARLCLYYENNLLQSAVVKTGVLRSSDLAPQDFIQEANEIHVDYVLTSTFQDVQSKFAERTLKLAPSDETGRHPVALNLTLNDDGLDGHRLLVKDQSTVSPAWGPYDPKANSDLLERARQELLNCFWLRDSKAKVVFGEDNKEKNGFNKQNGKTLEQFSRDLFALAQLGYRLYNAAFIQMTPDANWRTQIDWLRALGQTLKASSVIQVARTPNVPSNYAFPWGLLYEYSPPTPPKTWRWCDIMQEWSDEGIRDKPLTTTCPYSDQSWHQDHVLCPFGFWGLKHVIEQPLTVLRKSNGNWDLRDAVKMVATGAEMDLAVGITKDAELDATVINSHLGKLRAISNVRFTPDTPAEDANTVLDMMQAPEIVYFLCHGEYDQTLNEAYLGVGLRDDDPVHRIYPNTLAGWARTPTSPNLAAWSTQRPLVFINGCHTCNLKPGEVASLAQAFSLAGASGVLGTEITVRLSVAMEVAERLFAKMAMKTPIGQAMREIRWELANKGNLLGLSYTLYGLADLQIM